jgi:hypothetical protein
MPGNPIRMNSVTWNLELLELLNDADIASYEAKKCFSMLHSVSLKVIKYHI